MKQNYFGILGYGYVGRATHHGLLKNQSVAIHDTNLGTSLENLADVKNIFICTPTGSHKDVDVLINDVKTLAKINSNAQIIIRSTLPIGVGQRIQKEIDRKLIYIPEFLRERFWDTDSLKRPLIVGHDGAILPKWLSSEEIFECSVVEAELVKMFSNNFAVLRIAFANLFFDLAEKTGSDYTHIKNMYFKVAHDQTYMEVPGHDGTRGFGGKCLPKDLDFLIESLYEFNLDSKWFEQVKELNNKWQEKF